MPDLALAAVLVAAVEAELWWYDGGPAGVAVVTAVASALHAGALAFRTSRPALMAGVMTTVLWGQAMLGGRMTTTLVTAMAGMVMVFSVGLLLPRRRALLQLAVGARVAPMSRLAHPRARGPLSNACSMSTSRPGRWPEPQPRSPTMVRP